MGMANEVSEGIDDNMTTPKGTELAANIVDKLGGAFEYAYDEKEYVMYCDKTDKEEAQIRWPQKYVEEAPFSTLMSEITCVYILAAAQAESINFNVVTEDMGDRPEPGAPEVDQSAVEDLRRATDKIKDMSDEIDVLADELDHERSKTKAYEIMESSMIKQMQQYRESHDIRVGFKPQPLLGGDPHDEQFSKWPAETFQPNIQKKTDSKTQTT